jgi:hypothetical protein
MARAFLGNNAEMPKAMKIQRVYSSPKLEDLQQTSSERECECESSSDMVSKSFLQKAVSFTSVEIREYNVIVGDHPCCASGFPLTLDWEYREVSNIEVDTYEEVRSPRRHKEDLKISPEERCQLLSEDCSADDLRKAQRQLHRARSCSAKLCERVNSKFFS